AARQRTMGGSEAAVVLEGAEQRVDRAAEGAADVVAICVGGGEAGFGEATIACMPDKTVRQFERSGLNITANVLGHHRMCDVGCAERCKRCTLFGLISYNRTVRNV